MTGMAASEKHGAGSRPEDVSEPAGRYQPFAHLTTENSALYRWVMGVFVRAKQEFTVHLRPEDVHLGLPAEGRPPLETVTRALEALARWGNLRADPDTGRVTALEDFYRARHIYQLTRAGEAAEEALAAYDEALGRRGELQAVALADIAVQLRVLLGLVQEREPDSAVAHLSLLALVDRFSGLAENARAFMSSLQRTVDLHEAEVEVFIAYKQRLIDYLERFIEDLVTRGAEIAALLTKLGTPTEGGPAGRLLRLAAEREATDAAPDAAVRAVAAAEQRWQGRWEGLRAWFLSVPGRGSQAKLLRSAARQAVPQLLSVVRALNDRRSGRSDRSADFRELARWFAEAPDDDARHRLWRSAFGLHSARHLTIDRESADRLDDEPVPPSTSWYEAPGIRISPQLRRTGSYERRGRARAVQDRTEARSYLAELARKQSEQTAAARARLDTRGEVRLSDLEELDRDSFRLFLLLLGDALSAWRPGTQRVTATTNDGTMEITLTRFPEGGTAEIHTLDGVLRGPEHLVEIIDLTADRAPAGAGAGRIMVDSRLGDALAVQRADEVRRAARALLHRPLLRAGGPHAEDFRLVRQHATELRTWFERNTGWALLVDSEVARLRRVPGRDTDPTHPARDQRTGLPFSRRRYVLFCLCLSVLERAEHQIALGRLAEHVVLAAADPALETAGAGYTLAAREERADLVAVVRLLLRWGLLTKVAGDEDAFLSSAGDALYDVDRRVLASLLVSRRGPSTVRADAFEERLAELNAEVLPDSDELRNRALRHTLTRRLLDDPVLYGDELSEAESAYLASQRGALTRRVAELTGLVPEVRAEGVAMVDPEDDLTDLRMPEQGTDGHVALLVAEFLAGRGGTVPLAELHRRVTGWALEHAGFWRRSATAPGAEAGLAGQAVDRLVALGLLERAETAEGEPAVRSRPALDRYRIGETILLEPGQAAPRRGTAGSTKKAKATKGTRTR